MHTVLALESIGDSLSEFAHNLSQSIFKGIYTTVYGFCESTFNGMFDSLNNKIGELSGSLTQSPEAWNGTAFGVAEDV